ncbi:hypothetical protein AVEN_240787-1 [Araneus ventricosus]|uniref:Uncharacterized protein n=1 Tax=Araneus ventricosus TaxID=182803 RepID=A0A4Y2MU73_ARAVE|nr:hypothetical protein AVEN_240787-1 [Araneus ventricosus]
MENIQKAQELCKRSSVLRIFAVITGKPVKFSSRTDSKTSMRYMRKRLQRHLMENPDLALLSQKQSKKEEKRRKDRGKKEHLGGIDTKNRTLKMCTCLFAIS